MQKDLRCSSAEAPKTVPVTVFVSARYKVAVRARNVFRWTSHTANRQLPRMYPETILYTHGW